MASKPAIVQSTCLKQVCELIPPFLVNRLARKHDVKTRTISPWSHVVALLYAQLTRSIGLNDVCDSLHIHKTPLRHIRGATPLSRNGFSYANNNRTALMAEDLFWEVLQHLEHRSSKFFGRNYRGYPRRLKRKIMVVDSSTIQLIASCMPWAKHRRRKAAAKLHLSLNLQNFLPSYVAIDTAKENDNKRARELCAPLGTGEIVVFDKAYVDFDHLNDLNERGVFWVSRAKENMSYRVLKRCSHPKGRVFKDVAIKMKGKLSQEKYPGQLRLIEAIVEVDGKDRQLTFITNNLEWSPSTICDLYRSRWAIETFFKQIKQVLQISDFLGHSKNAIQWQVWTALLAYVLLRYLAFESSWSHSFTRLFTLVRALLWSNFSAIDTLRIYGTARGPLRLRGSPDQAYLPRFKLSHGYDTGQQMLLFKDN